MFDGSSRRVRTAAVDTHATEHSAACRVESAGSKWRRHAIDVIIVEHNAWLSKGASWIYLFIYFPPTHEQGESADSPELRMYNLLQRRPGCPKGSWCNTNNKSIRTIRMRKRPAVCSFEMQWIRDLFISLQFCNYKSIIKWTLLSSLIFPSLEAVQRS